MITQSSNKAVDKRSGLAAIATPFERVPGCFEFKEQTQHSLLPITMAILLVFVSAFGHKG
jgi:hypothetical protein